MIEIREERDCVGCEGCVQACPVKCISKRKDTLGFVYPVVDKEKCIDCHLCEKVCPVINQNTVRRPLQVFAAKNRDEEVRLKSSSGGVFTALAAWIIEEGGVVFGARFDKDFKVIHDYTESVEGLKAFQGSKYVQSEIGETFKEAAQFLKEGRKVMFTGTPCQIAALRLFLRKDYGDQLITVDVVCHGAPGPAVWQTYLK